MKINIKPNNKKAYQLLHDGVVELGSIERNGMRLDREYIDKTISSTKERIREIETALRKDNLFKHWRRRFGQKTSLGSRDQLGVVLFDILGYKCGERTKSGRPKMDESVLASIDLKFVRDFLKLEKLKKIQSTYLLGIKRESIDGFIHPFFNLHTTRTYRSSSDKPNFQNIPIRVPEYAEIIRRAFIPRNGNRLVEIDYSGIEVRIAACYHEDPVMFKYINDPSKDMHRDMAAQCYKLKTKDVSKPIRHCGKNQFVFPQFYGDWYRSCAKSLWESIESNSLKGPDGKSLKRHLKRKGISRLNDPKSEDFPKKGTFEHHLKEVENDFWNNRFRVYGEWRKRWYDRYRKKGRFATLTGFEVSGIMSKNDVINYPVQGSAFHCLLWSLIRLNRELRRLKMKAKIVGQIHDSIVSDVPDNELKDFLQLAQRVMTEDLLNNWKWITVPLEVEAEATEVNQSWHTKKEIEIAA